MDEDRWEWVRSTFDAVMEVEPSERAARLLQLCGGDDELRRNVEQLIEGDAQADERLRHLDHAFGDWVSDDGSAARGAPDPFGLGGRDVSHFRVLEPLGAGGMGVVYRAEDLRLHRPVALKFMLPQHTLEAGAKARFLREARAAAALDHPNICTVHEVGETEDGHLFLAMSLYRGETLKERLTRDGALPVPAALDVATQIARGLARAHVAGIVHRDLKPANLMLTPDGSVKILDFGLAKATDTSLTGSGAVMGSLGYMSPEQLGGDPTDARTDLWSLGVVLFEMLTGERPLNSVPAAALTQDVDIGDLRRRRPELPGALVEIVGRLLRRDPAERYQAANDVLIDLGTLQTGDAPRLRPQRSALPNTLRSRVGVGALILIAGSLAALWYRETSAGADGSGATSTAISMAVLPLKNYSGNPAQEYFADGMTEELTTTLTKIEVLRVIAPQSVLQFKHTARPVPEIARLLNVMYVVDGSVLQDGDSVRITASLIDAKRNTSVWSASIVRERRDVMALQREVALAIARAIEVALTPQDQSRLVSAPKVDPEAFDLYIRGTQERYAANFSGDFSAATRYLSQAIAKDSTYAAAYAGLAFIYAFNQEQERAQQFVSKALQFDPTLAEAHMVQGMVREFFDRDWAGAERAFREAIRLNPGYAETHHELSMLLMRRRRFDEALLEGQRTVSLAPMSARFESGIGEVYAYGGQYEKALAVADPLVARDSTFPGGYYVRGLALTHLRRYAEAAEAWRRCVRIAPIGFGFARAQLGYIYAMTGRRVEALKVLDTLKAQWRVRQPSPSTAAIAADIATVHTGLGQTKEALDWLERSVAAGAPSLYLGIDPTFRSLHAEPRYRALLKNVGLDE